MFILLLQGGILLLICFQSPKAHVYFHDEESLQRWRGRASSLQRWRGGASSLQRWCEVKHLFKGLGLKMAFLFSSLSFFFGYVLNKATTQQIKTHPCFCYVTAMHTKRVAPCHYQYPPCVKTCIEKWTPKLTLNGPRSDLSPGDIT